ncbi:MAG: dimethylmenaquinone methyltransferase [Chloroflexota bacterium]
MTEQEKIARLAELGTSTVYEAAGREGIIDLPLHQLIPGSRVGGRARTVLCGQGDNVMIHACIEHIQPGEVLVIAQPESKPQALLGDMLVTQIVYAGAVGIILNGAVRDVEELREIGLPIWAEFIRMRGPTKDKPGLLNVPVTMGDNIIYPGDIVLMDADGAMTVRPSRLDEILEKAEARAAKEAEMRERYAKGERSYDLRGWRESVEAPR